MNPYNPALSSPALCLLGDSMRSSRLLNRTLFDVPADAELASHQLMARGGYIRRIGAVKSGVSISVKSWAASTPRAAAFALDRRRSAALGPARRRSR